MKFVLILFCVVFISACTSMSNKATLIKEADEKMVYQQDCNFLGLVSGTSGWGNLAASAGISNAKNEALDKAAILGASHVIWTSVNAGFMCSVTGRAYDCNKPVSH